MGTRYVAIEYTEAFGTAVLTPQRTAKMEGMRNISSLVQGCDPSLPDPTGAHGPVVYPGLAREGSKV